MACCRVDGIFFQADDVFAHHAGNGRVQLRMDQTLDLVGIIRRRDDARPAVRKITQRMDVAQFVGA